MTRLYLTLIHRHTRTGRPPGSEAFLRQLEAQTGLPPAEARFEAENAGEGGWRWVANDYLVRCPQYCYHKRTTKHMFSK